MSAVSEAISAQADLLWSVALAALVAEVYLLARFLARGWERLGLLARAALVFSVAAHAISMFCGYLTYGAVVELARVAADTSGAQQSYNDAMAAAFFQFVFFALGILTFVAAFFLNARLFGEAMND